MSKSACTRESLILCLAIAAAGGYSFFTPFIKKLFANGVYPARKITADIARTMEKTLAEKIAVERFVFFLGYHDDIQNLMSQLDIVVLSSLWEGLPLTPIEAFSVGTAIIATAVDGTTEVVEDGKSGILISPRSFSQIAEKINWSIEHPREIKNMEIAGKERFENEFSFEALRQNYIKYYRNLG